jgi:hypothetical protein
MLVKIIEAYRNIVIICDSELIGKRFEKGKFQLDLTGEFFKGEKISEGKTIKLMQNMSKDDAIFNIVGKKSVNAALKSKIISQEGIKKIQGVPFALILL